MRVACPVGLGFRRTSCGTRAICWYQSPSNGGLKNPVIGSWVGTAAAEGQSPPSCQCHGTGTAACIAGHWGPCLGQRAGTLPRHQQPYRRSVLRRDQEAGMHLPGNPGAGSSLLRVPI